MLTRAQKSVVGLVEIIGISGPDAVNESRTLRVLALIATIGLGLVIWIGRRPDQLTHPYVWVEEYKLLNAYQTNGFMHTISMPVNGYFVWPTSATVSVAAAISFLHLPLIDYVLSTAWFVATLCLILIPRSPLPLTWRIGMVGLLVLAPMNPEVFGIALYIFWWTTLWPLISLIWSEDNWRLRIPVLIVGGMSSIAGSALVVPYAILFAITRKRRYLVGTALLGVTSIVQAICYLTSARVGQVPLLPRSIAVQELRNFSDYAFGWLNPVDHEFLGFAGAAILVMIFAVVAYAAIRARTPHTNEIIGFVIGLIVLSVLSSVPAPLTTVPASAGPRYYFLPYVVTGWTLLMIALTSELRWARGAATVLVGLSLLSLSQNFARHDEFVSWSSQLAQCQSSKGPFYVPVQFDGLIADMWQGNLLIQPQTCRRMGYR